MNWLQTKINRSMNSFVEKRLPREEKVTLEQSKIFIVPTRQGLLLLMIAAMILLLAINFESSLNYALAFWLISMLWVAVHLTFRNLSGLTIEAHAGNLVCVGDVAEVTLKLSSKKKVNRGVLELIHEDWGSVHAWLPEQQAEIRIPLKAFSRGPVLLPRFRIETRYPFGLVVAWTNLLIDVKAWAYPEGMAYDRTSDQSDGDDEQSINDHFFKSGSEDFHSLRSYVPGDPIKRLHWPGFSRDLLLVKSFSDYQSSDEMIDWAHFPGVPDELKLSAIAHYAQQFYEKNLPFGLRMPDEEIEPDKGIEHLTRVRRILAEYGYV